MFIGEFQHTLDAKGRIFVPSKFRDDLGENFIITIGLDNCLFVFPQEEFDRLKAKIDALSITNKDARTFSRFFFGHAGECEMDKQGRIMIPQNLRAFANLSKDVTVVGVSNRVELWDTAAWEDAHNFDKFSPEELAEKLGQLGI